MLRKVFLLIFTMLAGFFGQSVGETLKEEEEAEEIVENKYIALTFDDGPHEEHTIRLLDALLERDIKATFFVLGYEAEKHPEIILRMYNEGHSIGNHTINHYDLTIKSREVILYEIEETNRIIYDILGKNPTLFRPPFGNRNDLVIEVAKELNLPLILWSIDPEDWRVRDAEVIRDAILGSVHNGGVILLHDIVESSIDAAIMAIDILIEQGYTFVTIEELFNAGGIELESGGIYHRVRFPKPSDE